MAVYTIADLHLSTGTDKAMDVFGHRWIDYTNKIINRWKSVISENDTVIIPGDISWAMTLDEAESDFALIDSLPGKKILGKGNHDFWWSTLSKIKTFLEKNKFDSVSPLFNNAYAVENIIVCGTRGWFYDEKQQVTVGENVDFHKISSREAQRLKLSLDEAVKIRQKIEKDLPIVAFTHFPVVWGDFVCREMIDLMHEYGVKSCYHGHIHGNYTVEQCSDFEGIRMTLVSADFLNFSPAPVFENKI